MPKVLIAPMTLANLPGAFVQALLGAGFEVVYPGQAAQLTEDELLAALDGRAFGMSLLAYDPVPDPAFAEGHGVALVPFERLLAEANFLSLHLPLSAATRHLINRDTLARMRPTAFLVNTARGGLVCEA